MRSVHLDLAIKRLFDFIWAATGLIILTPLLVCVAVLIIGDDGFPVFFRQLRIGLNGRPFNIIKFRTMRVGSLGALITAAKDPRVTRVGATLRRYKLDELPQLINVVRGEMSFVGPRPEVPEYVNIEVPIWRAVLSVRPGITDPAAIAFQDEERKLTVAGDPMVYYRQVLLPAKLRLSLAYLQAKSFWKDLRLIGLTVSCLLLRNRQITSAR